MLPLKDKTPLGIIGILVVIVAILAGAIYYFIIWRNKG